MTLARCTPIEPTALENNGACKMPCFTLISALIDFVECQIVLPKFYNPCRAIWHFFVIFCRMRGHFRKMQPGSSMNQWLPLYIHGQSAIKQLAWLLLKGGRREITQSSGGKNPAFAGFFSPKNMKSIVNRHV
jgi:hypothetical protein